MTRDPLAEPDPHTYGKFALVRAHHPRCLSFCPPLEHVLLMPEACGCLAGHVQSHVLRELNKITHDIYMHIYLLDSVVEFPIPQNPKEDLTQVLTLLT